MSEHEDLPGTLRLPPGLLRAMPLDELGYLVQGVTVVRYAWQRDALRELAARLAPRQDDIVRWDRAFMRAYDELSGTGQPHMQVQAQAIECARQRLGLGGEEAEELFELDSVYLITRNRSAEYPWVRHVLAGAGLTFGERPGPR
jgi:hypothetical protein